MAQVYNIIKLSFYLRDCYTRIEENECFSISDYLFIRFIASKKSRNIKLLTSHNIIQAREVLAMVIFSMLYLAAAAAVTVEDRVYFMNFFPLKVSLNCIEVFLYFM